MLIIVALDSRCLSASSSARLSFAEITSVHGYSKFKCKLISNLASLYCTFMHSS